MLKHGVSFVIPVYNKAAQLPNVLTSLKAVAVPVPAEFIFVDDGSDDDSLQIIKEQTKNWENVCVISQKNAGPSKATNAGIFKAKYRFLKLVDGDDCLTPWGVAHLLELIEKHSAALVFGCHETSGKIPVQAQKKAVVEVFLNPLKLAIKGNLTTPSPSLMDTEKVHAFGGCDEREFVQDASLCMGCALAGPVVRSSEVISYGEPEGGEGRVSANAVRERVVGNRTLLRLLEEHPSRVKGLEGYAFQRAAGRMWKWCHRRKGAKVFSAPHRLYLASLLPWRQNYKKLIQQTIDFLEK